MTGVTYDTGLLLAAEAGRVDAWAFHASVLRRGVLPTVPVVVLAQAWRGGPQAPLSRLLKGCRVEANHEVDGRAAGRACARAGTSDVVDALVVVGALRRGDLVVTSDPVDLQRLASAIGRRIALHRI